MNDERETKPEPETTDTYYDPQLGVMYTTIKNGE